MTGYRLAPWLLLFCCHLAAANALKNHPSPYLAMHGEDPVEWRDWGSAAIAEARGSGKLLYLSSGYFSCHWCHVMQRESYQNREVADVLNSWFIPVKLDRELQPALDDYLISFVEQTEGHAGWPLNVFLTPEGYPLVGMTYLPREHFQELLQKLQKMWEQEPHKLREMALSMHAQLQQHGMATTPATKLPDGDGLLERVIAAALASGDDLQGGFGHANRFPMVPQLRLLLEAQRLQPSPKLHAFIRLTLEQMAAKGLRDHLGGGFFRYAVDPGWETPHYEKMLYTQALLASLYLRAADLLNEPRYREVVADTLDFVLQQMRGDGGAYIASLSAVDAEGNEGGSYLWSEAQLRRLLSGDQLRLALQHWRFTFGEQLPGQALPHAGEPLATMAKAHGVSLRQLGISVEQIRAKLLNQRASRLPPRDLKQLAAWNGLLLTALSEAAQQLRRDDYRQAAAELAAWLQTLWDGRRLARSSLEGTATGSASLADYAYVAQGLKSWGELAGDQQLLQISKQLTAAAWKRFYSDKGWRLGDEMLIPGIAGKPLLADGPMPSPAAVLMALGDEHSGGQFARALRISVDGVLRSPLWNAGHLWQLFVAQQSRENTE